jgi:hypothetical protein
MLQKSVLFPESGAINSYSDFDFTYYINTLDDAKYKKLLKHFMIRIKGLRDELNQQIDDSEDKIKTKNKKLHFETGDYLNKNGKNITHAGIETYNLNIILSPDTKNSIITKPDPEIDNINIFTLDDLGKSMNITFNNTIITSTGVDFDLLRIKLGFDTDNNIKKSNFKSEIFDLTVMRSGSEGREDFCNEIDDYTIIIKSTYNGDEYFIRAYNIIYTLKDILLMLFETNQPLNSIFLWADKKYNKRVIRLALLCSEYIDNIADYEERTKEFYKALFIYKYISDFFEYLDEIKASEDKDERQQIVLSILLNVQTNYIRLFNETCYNDFNTHLFDGPNRIRDIMNGNINIDNIRKLIHEKEFLNFMIMIITVYIKKIFVDKDVDWCKINYDDSLETIDLCDFQIQLINFLKIFSTYLLLGMTNITKLLEERIAEIRDVYHELTDMHGGAYNSQKKIVKLKEKTAEPKEIFSELDNQSKSPSEISRKNKFTIPTSEDLKFIKNLIELAENLEKNYEKDEENKYEINYIKNNKIVKTIIKEPKLIKKEIYDNDLDDLVDTHFELISNILNLNVDVKKTDEKKISDEVNNYM